MHEQAESSRFAVAAGCRRLARAHSKLAVFCALGRSFVSAASSNSKKRKENACTVPGTESSGLKPRCADDHKTVPICCASRIPKDGCKPWTQRRCSRCSRCRQRVSNLTKSDLLAAVQTCAEAVMTAAKLIAFIRGPASQRRASMVAQKALNAASASSHWSTTRVALFFCTIKPVICAGWSSVFKGLSCRRQTHSNTVQLCACVKQAQKAASTEWLTASSTSGLGSGF